MVLPIHDVQMETEITGAILNVMNLSNVTTVLDICLIVLLDCNSTHRLKGALIRQTLIVVTEVPHFHHQSLIQTGRLTHCVHGLIMIDICSHTAETADTSGSVGMEKKRCLSVPKIYISTQLYWFVTTLMKLDVAGLRPKMMKWK